MTSHQSPDPTHKDFLRQLARSRRFTAGEPQGFRIGADGTKVAFLRSDALWLYESEAERPLLDEVSDYSVSRDLGRIACTRKDGSVWLVTPEGQSNELLPAESGVDEPLIDPLGLFLSYVKNNGLGLISCDSKEDRVLLAAENEHVSYGRPEFTGGVSIGRHRGHWWSPDGSRMLVTRVDTTSVQTWHKFDPGNPEQAATEIPYPTAGTPNAEVSLVLVDLQGNTVEVDWDSKAFEYLIYTSWPNPEVAAPYAQSDRLLIAVQSRDHRRVQVLEVDPGTGATTVVRQETDPHWVQVAEGTPATTSDGELVWVSGDSDTYRLRIGDEFVSPPGLQLFRIEAIDGGTVLFTAWNEEPSEVHVFSYEKTKGIEQLTTTPGVHFAARANGTTILHSFTLDGTVATVDGRPLGSDAEKPLLDLKLQLISVGERELRTSVFLPSWHEPGAQKLPVLLSPYAGPGAQMVHPERGWKNLLMQWFAEQGFAVIATDGRGTPGRGLAWERAIAGDIVGPVLQDQIDGLHGAAERFPDLDLERVAMRGWSFSGYLAALAVLHRPDVFHAAIAGAALSDQRLYDTFWKERFLGDPTENAEAYRACSLLPFADQLTKPLLIIQGMTDTNVWPVHMLRFSAALLAAGKPHSVIPLPGQGHRPMNPDVIANLPLLELDFLRRSL